jgi:hypothetical protein
VNWGNHFHPQLDEISPTQWIHPLVFSVFNFYDFAKSFADTHNGSARFANLLLEVII